MGAVFLNFLDWSRCIQVVLLSHFYHNTSVIPTSMSEQQQLFCAAQSWRGLANPGSVTPWPRQPGGPGPEPGPTGTRCSGGAAPPGRQVEAYRYPILVDYIGAAPPRVGLKQASTCSLCTLVRSAARGGRRRSRRTRLPVVVVARPRAGVLSTREHRGDVGGLCRWRGAFAVRPRRVTARRAVVSVTARRSGWRRARCGTARQRRPSRASPGRPRRAQSPKRP